jgi:nitric oxide reductase subunit B
VLFIVGGVLPFLWIAWLGIRHFRTGEVTHEMPEDVLFTELEPVGAGERQ